jgi:NAD(P)-dependent dehydrogenase (short-subunit alcohol dehydrogenase family)
MQVDLSQQVALVTGAARGIGKVIADTLVVNGARVVYTDIDRAEVERSASASPGATAMEMDVTSEVQVQSVTKEIARRFGRVDILVDNAGVNTMAHREPSVPSRP